MSRFLMWPAFRQFGKNWKNRPNFKDAVLHGWGRLIWKNRGKQRKPLPELSSLINLTHCRLILPVSAGTCNYYYPRASEWKDDIHIIIRPDLFLSTSGTTTIPRFDQTCNCQGLAVFWQSETQLADPSAQQQHRAIARVVRPTELWTMP